MMPQMLSRLGYEIRQYKRGHPTVASFDITERCELHCKMCRFWIDGNHDEESELPARDLCSLIDELHDDLGVRRVRLLGGEPFLRADAMDIVRHAKARRLHVNVVSEGSHVNESKAEEIVRSGLDSIRFSVDGIGHRHDVVRGRVGAFEEVSGAIRRVQAAKRRLGSKTPEVQIFAVISACNHDQLLPLHEACESEFAPARLLFGPVWEATTDQVESSVWQGRQLADRHHLPIGKSLQLSEAQMRVFRSHVEEIRGSRRSDGIGRMLSRLVRPILSKEVCPETHSFHVDPFGRIKFCSVYMNYAYGKYPESSVKQIWFSRRHREFHRDLAGNGFLPLCTEVCGNVDEYYVGTPRQLARNVLLRLVPSPLRGSWAAGRDRFSETPPDLVIDPEPLALGTHPWIGRRRERAARDASEPAQGAVDSSSRPGSPKGTREPDASVPFSLQ